MKINTHYDGKSIRVEFEAPPEDLRKFSISIANFFVRLFEGDKKVDDPKEGQFKKGGGS